MSGCSTMIAEVLLAWYDRQGRRLPWRFSQEDRPDPYVVWLSEVMLQQTTVVTVIPYFRTFLARWPTVAALAAASLDDVLKTWAGLGYYARARNLHRGARYIVTQREGRFPEHVDELRQIPGVGEYTASMIAAIVFGRRSTVIDGNIERIITRLFAVTDPLPKAKSQVRLLTDTLVPYHRPGDFAQAMMDLGATVCTPAKPQCLLCPLRSECRAYALGMASSLPHKLKKSPRPIRRGTAFWLITPADDILLRRRAEHGLLGGMIEIPSTSWRSGRFPDKGEILAAAPLLADWKPLEGIVRHTFTHFHLEISVVRAYLKTKMQVSDGFWIALDTLSDYALPVVMHKVIHHARRAS